MAYSFEHIGEVAVTETLNPCPPGDNYTVAIVGVPRGGTTMVAAVVDALGIDLGPRADLEGWHFEDQTMHSPYIDVQIKYAMKRNAEHSRWGWKDPTGLSSVRNVLFALRNPRIVMVFRDPLATIQGEMRFDAVNEISPRRTVSDLYAQTMEWLKYHFDFAVQTAFPVLLVSYERAMTYPDRFLSELTGFLGIQPTDEQRADALARIERRGGYIVFDKECPKENGATEECQPSAEPPLTGDIST